MNEGVAPVSLNREFGIRVLALIPITMLPQNQWAASGAVPYGKTRKDV